MRILKFVFPIMIIVAWSSWLLLERNFLEVPETNRLYITIGATILSGVVSYFLFPQDEEHKNDKLKK